MNRLKKIKYIGVFIAVCFFSLVITGCSGGNATTYTTFENALKEVQINNIKNSIDNYVNKEGMSEEEVKKVKSITATALSNFTTEANFNDLEKNVHDMVTALHEKYPDNSESVDKAVNLIMYDQLLYTRNKAKEILPSFTTKKDVSKREDFQIQLCDESLAKWEGILKDEEIELTADLAGKTESTVVEDTRDIYQIVKNYTIEVSQYEIQQGPLRFYGFDNGFWGHLFNNFIVFPIGWMMMTISKLLGGYYILGLIIVTILVRTAAWPIYAKSNDMSLKMQIMQPELNKLEAKYADRQDQESQRMKQMEQMQIYKKYKVGIGGCLMPLVQFPIFMGMYRAISRMPYTDGKITGTSDWISDLNTKIFGVDLFGLRGELWSGQFWGIIIILILVVATQILTQVITDRRQKQQQAKSQENIPEYRRQAVAQNSTQKSMKFMMYFMIFMMAVFVWQSPAGLGFYWFVGNLYSLAQMTINQKLSARRMEKIKEKHSY